MALVRIGGTEMACPLCGGELEVHIVNMNGRLMFCYQCTSCSFDTDFSYLPDGGLYIGDNDDN